MSAGLAVAPLWRRFADYEIGSPAPHSARSAIRRKALVQPLLVLLSVPLLGPLSPAAAQEAGAVRVAVLGLEGRGVAAPVLARLSRACVQSLSRLRGHRPLPGKSLEEVKLVFGCMDEGPRCMAGVGKSLGAKKLLWGSVRARGRNLLLRLKVLDVASRKLRRGRRVVLVAAEIESPMRIVAGAIDELLGVRSGTIRLMGPVSGAEVSLDGQSMGKTDGGAFVLRDVAPGTHVLTVQKAGEPAWTKTVELVGGGTLTLAAGAIGPAASAVGAGQASAASEAAGSSTRGWKIAFWTSLALTAALGGAVVATGLTVRAAEDEKEAALDDLDNQSGRGFDGAQLDAMRRQGCDASVRTADLAAACNKGVRYRRATNIMIGPLAGLGALTALFGGIWLYKALGGAPDEAPRNGGGTAEARLSDKASVRLLPTAGPNGQGAGLLIQF